MKNIKYIAFFLLSLLMVTGCSDWLKEENKTSVTSDFLYSNPQALERAVIALYAIDRSYFRLADTSSPFAYMLDIGTDLDWFRGGEGATFANYDALNSKNTNVSDFWTQQYGIIGKCNEILAAAQTMEQDSLVKKVIGEASLFRAHAYYWLMIKFGRLYLTTTPVTYDNIGKTTYTPAPEADIWNLINSDLDVAINNLSWNKSIPGRFNKGVAKHIKALVAMWNKNWQEAIKQTEDIFASGQYSLLPAPQDVFDGGKWGAPGDLNHSETIFAYQFKNDVGGGGTIVDGLFRGHRLGIITVAQYRTVTNSLCNYDFGCYGWGRLAPNNYLFSLYKDKVKDKRYQQYFRHYFTYWAPETLPSPNPQGKVVGDTIVPTAAKYWDLSLHPQCKKFEDKWTALAPAQTSSFKDIIMYRLAETYLIAAEAYMNVGNQAKAREYYNKTWMRAGNAEETGEITLQMIMDEQARELCMEGHRFSFLKRIGKLTDQIRNYGGEFTTNPTAAGRNLGVKVPTSYKIDFSAYVPATAADRRYYFKDGYANWPIPQSEIDQMGADNFPQWDAYK